MLSRVVPLLFGSAALDVAALALGGRGAMLLAASAWPALALLARPYSNSSEAVLLALALAGVVMLPARRRWLAHALAAAALGVVGALAFFVRFTAPAFALPGTSCLFCSGAIGSRACSVCSCECSGCALFTPLAATEHCGGGGERGCGRGAAEHRRRALVWQCDGAARLAPADAL